MTKINPFERFNRDWALVTAGTPGHFNSMTISWGSMGTIWGKSVITVYIRPDRFTWQFLKESDTFTVSFYPEEERPALEQMGTLSGRDVDKPAASGLTPKFLENGVTYAEAAETFVCRKIYMAPMKREDVPDVAKKIYVGGIEPHYIIMGEVMRREARTFRTDGERTWLEDETGRQIALLEHPQVRPGVVNLAHTEVDPSFGGQGIAGRITETVAKQLRAGGTKAELSCSYSIKWFAQHPEYADVLADPEEEVRKAEMLAGPACGLPGRRQG